ncbi:hypothetical protein BEL04_11255 [Mucilaginibacter sp. PPCGB 2223]|nr:hypothetical protein BEL04_11255 [Mucilaginibacter sp. PPCGB 2223]
MQAYITINTTAEFFCLMVSLFCLYKDKAPVWRAFILFLLITCMVEGIGIYVHHTLRQPNFAVYNVFLPVECFVQNCFFYYLYKPYHSHKKLLVAWLSLFAVFYFSELIILHFKAFTSVTSTLLSVQLILASVYYYYLLLKEEKYRRLSAYAPFWWVNGTICFYFGGVATNVFFSYLVQYPGVFTHSARYIVFNILNVILYSSWAYSFICRYRQKTSRSSF